MVFIRCPCGQLTVGNMRREISEAEHTEVETKDHNMKSGIADATVTLNITTAVQVTHKCNYKNSYDSRDIVI